MRISAKETKGALTDSNSKVGCVIDFPAWLKDAAVQNGPILPWSPVPSHCCKRDLGTGLAPTGYKLMRRVSQKQKGSALDLLNKRYRNFNGKRGSKRTQLHLQRNGPDTIVARHALSPSTPRAFRRDPPGSGGLTARRGQARGLPCHQCRTALA